MARIKKGLREIGEHMPVVFTCERPWKMEFALKSVESSEVNEVVQVDHQKICMADSGYDQILVIIELYEVGRSGTTSDSLSGRDL